MSRITQVGGTDIAIITIESVNASGCRVAAIRGADIIIITITSEEYYGYGEATRTKINTFEYRAGIIIIAIGISVTTVAGNMGMGTARCRVAAIRGADIIIITIT